MQYTAAKLESLYKENKLEVVADSVGQLCEEEYLRWNDQVRSHIKELYPHIFFEWVWRPDPGEDSEGILMCMAGCGCCCCTIISGGSCIDCGGSCAQGSVFCCYDCCEGICRCL